MLARKAEFFPLWAVLARSLFQRDHRKRFLREIKLIAVVAGDHMPFKLIKNMFAFKEFDHLFAVDKRRFFFFERFHIDDRIAFIGITMGAPDGMHPFLIELSAQRKTLRRKGLGASNKRRYRNGQRGTERQSDIHRG